MSARANRRRALVMADQGISSLSNVVVSILAARSLTADGFGAFGVATAAFLLALGASRAVIGEPLLSRYSSADVTVRRAVVPDILGAALVTGIAGAGVVAATALVVGGLAGATLLGLAWVLPLIILQDVWRYVFIVDRPGAAVVVDAVWLVVVCATISAAPAHASPRWFVVAWGASAGAGAVAGALIHRDGLDRPRPSRWIRANRDMASRFLGEFATGQAVGQLALVGTGAVAGLGVAGAVRAAQVFYGPLNTVHQGIYLALVPEGARAASAARLRRLMSLATILLVGLAAAWMLVGLVLPDQWGTTLFSDTWDEAEPLMLPMGLAMVAGSAATGGFAGVRALGAARESLRARLRTAGPQLVLPLAGAAVASGVGFAVGFGAGHALSAAIWWSAFSAALSARARDRDDEPVTLRGADHPTTTNRPEGVR